MDRFWKQMVWRQFGGALEMLENAIRACPEGVWKDRTREQEFWYMAYHTLFWLDLYLSGGIEGFAPPEPFNLDELDPAGILPQRVYTQAEMLAYLEHGRRKGRLAIDQMTEAAARKRCVFPWGEVSAAELLLYNLRHVQHHAAQLNLLLRQITHAAPGWVAFARSGREGPEP